jgi:uncharacterized protein YbjQ (UPF0145 family)
MRGVDGDNDEMELGGLIMQVNFAGEIGDDRAKTVIGPVKATSRWRAAEGMGSEAERRAAIEALMREAAEYGADAVVDVHFEVDDVRGHDIDGIALRRVTATGLAVSFARAA